MHLQLLVSGMKGISSLSFDKSLLDLCGFTVSTFFAVVLLCNLYYDWHWEALFLNSVYSYSDVLSLISYGIYSMSRPVYCTISTVSSRILKICWPRWPINFLLSSSDLKQGLFSWPLRVMYWTYGRNGTVYATILHSGQDHFQLGNLWANNTYSSISWTLVLP